MTRDSKAEKLCNKRGVATSLVSGIYRQATGNQIVLGKVMGLITEIFCNENQYRCSQPGYLDRQKRRQKVLVESSGLGDSSTVCNCSLWAVGELPLSGSDKACPARRCCDGSKFLRQCGDDDNSQKRKCCIFYVSAFSLSLCISSCIVLKEKRSNSMSYFNIFLFIQRERYCFLTN